MALIYSSNEILKRGLELVWVDAKRQGRSQRATNVERFKTEYGADPAVYAQIWEDLQTTSIAAAKIDPRTCNIDQFFIALYFLKRYPGELQQSNTFGRARNTIRKWRWYFVDRISALVAAKITWPEEWTKDNPAPVGITVVHSPLLGPSAAADATAAEEVAVKGLPLKPIITVDGVHFQRNEPTHGRYSKNPQYYSHKFHRSAVNYEIGIHLFESRVVHIRGPIPASKNDIGIFRQELLGKIPDGHLAIGDKGYLGEPDVMMTPNSHDTEEVRKFKGRARARHETFNKKLKRFECLDKRFIHKEGPQATCFEAVLVICQYDMEMGSPLFDI